MSETRLPTANVEEFVALRRQDAREALERRTRREKDIAIQAAEWIGPDAAPLDWADQFCVVCPRERAHDFLIYLRDQLGFDYMNDLTALDYLKHPQEHPDRFAVVYQLTNLEREATLRIRVYLDEDEPILPTASDVWPAANWAEREVYDMYGIEFSGHPNLIRLLMPTEYSGHPLRKDYPLRGRGERDNFPVIRRNNEAGL